MKAFLMAGCAAAVLALGQAAHGQTWQGRLSTFEDYPVGHTFAMDTYVDSMAVPDHYLISDYNLPGTPSATVADVGGGQNHVLTLSGGAAIAFKRPIWLNDARVDVFPTNGASGFLALDTYQYNLASVLATSGGILETGPSRWAYTVAALADGYSRITLRRDSGLIATQNPQFAVIAQGTLRIDNVDANVFPEPSSGTLAGIVAVGGALVRRKRQ